MQSLLADRFQLAIHFETRETQVLAVIRMDAARKSPGLRSHADGPACSVVLPRTTTAANVDMLPCNVYTALNEPDNVILAGARNTTPEQMAAFFSNAGHFGKPVVNQTGIRGKIDFAMEYTPEQAIPTVGTDGGTDLHGETFLEAMKDQLGLKLEPKRLPLSVPIVDHVELPSEN